MKRVSIQLWIICILAVFFALAGALKAALPPTVIGSWTSASALSQARANAASVVLPDGRIVIIGGDGVTGPLQSVEVFATDGTISSLASMSVARSHHVAVVLGDGRVLVGGGTANGGGTTNSAEIYDPTVDSWTQIGPMTSARANASAALLQDGRVLIAGGDNAGIPSNTVEIFDPSTGNFSFAGTLSSPRTKQAMAVLQDGRVLIAGGFDGTNALASCDIFDASTGAVTAGPSLATPRYSHSATTLLNGQVVVIGGATTGNNGAVDVASAEVFDPTTGVFANAGISLTTARESHQAFLLPNNNSVLVVGGTSSGQVVPASELFVPQVSSADGSWSYAFSPTASNVTPRTAAIGSALQQDGLLLVAGGNDASGSALASTELYAFPVVKTDATDYPPGTTVTISGSGFKPGEIVNITLVESPLIDTHGPYAVTADGNGNFSDSSFSTDIHDLNVRFWLRAVGSQSGLVANNTFTDATNVQTNTTLSAISTPLTSGQSGVAFSGTVSSTDPSHPFPASVNEVVQLQQFSNANCNGNSTVVGSVTVTPGTATMSFNYSGSFTAPTVATTTTFFYAAQYQGVGQGSGSTAVNWQKSTSQCQSITVNPPTVNTTTTVTTSANPSVYGTAVTFTATVHASTGSTAPAGSVTFTIDGAPGSAIGLGACSPPSTASACATTSISTLTVGPHTVAASYTHTGSFVDSSGTLSPSQSVNTATLTVKADPQTKQYGQTDPTLTYSATGFQLSDTSATVLTGALARATGENVAGSPYAITQGTLAANANYTISFTGSTLTITPAPLTITANAQTKQYGNSDPALTYSASGFKFTDTAATVLTGSLARAAGENVAGSPYAITQGTLAANANYAISFTGNSLTITPAPLTVTANAQTKQYGSADPALTYSATGFKFTDTAATVLTGALARTTGENVAGSPYAITQGTLAANANYTISFTGSTLTITPAPLTVTANAQAKQYGNADPALTYSATGFKFTDTAATVLTGALARTAGENVAGSPYAITQGTLAGNANYTISFTGSTLTITPAPLTVTANAQAKQYGNADPALTYSATGFQFADTAATVLTGALARTAGENVAGSPYAITQGTLAANANYTISFTGSALAITPAPLTVAADPQTKQYGSADPTLTYSASGFKFTDTAATVLTGALARAAGENVAGSPYAITQGTLAANANYTISFTGSTLTITPAPLTVAADPQTKQYGNTDPTLTYSASGFKFTDAAATVLTGALARAVGENVAGSPYAITQGTLASNSNYTINFTGNNLAITPAPLTITANAQTKQYGSADPTLTYSASGFKFTDTAATVLTGALARVAGENVAGSPYPINQGTLASNPNYTISFAGSTLTITPAPLTIVADPQTKQYGDADPPLTYTASGFKFSDTAALLTGMLTRTAGETVAGSPYLIGQGTLTANSNYTIAFTGANLIITPRPASVTPNAATKIYGDPDPAFSGTLTGFLVSDNVVASYSRSAGETVAGSPYTISATLSPAGVLGNYAITYNTAQFTITPRPASVTPNAATKIYGDPDPAFSGTLTGFLGSDNVVASYSRTAGETVAGSPYSISATLSPAGVLGNYNITYNTAPLTITPRPASVTPNGATKTYGDPDPAFSGTLTGFLAADNVVASYSRTTGETVAGSPYSISATLSPAGVLGNYTITYNTAPFTITPRPASVTPNGATKIYGDPDPAFSGTLTGFLAADNVVASYGRTTGETVAGSPYTISATLTPAGVLGNYAITYNTASLTITPAPLNVTADVQTKVYGNADPTLTYHASGFKFSDTPASVLTGSLSRAAGESVAGSPYSITQGSLIANSNYTMSFTGNTLTVTPRPITVTPTSAQTKVYGTTPDPALTFTVGGSGLASWDTVAAVFTGSLSRAAGENVGAYAIMQGTLQANANYNLTFTSGITFAITPAPLTITPDGGKSKIVGSIFTAFTGSVTGLKFSDAVSISYTSAGAPAAAGVGSYDITVASYNFTVGSATNYNITMNTAVKGLSVYYSTGACLGSPGHAILQPINPDGSSVFKQKSTVPAKFRVCDASGNSIGTPGVVQSFRMTGFGTGTLGAVDESVDSTNPDTAFRWDPTGQQWIFNMDTKSLSANVTYQYTITLNDGTSIVFVFGLR